MSTKAEEKFLVRDMRHKQWFMVDDVYLNGYARYFDTTTTAIYLSLCRHVDRYQKSFPSQKLMAEQHNISPRTVRRKLKELEKANIIKFDQERSDGGKWKHNTYILLDKSEWVPVEELPNYKPSATRDRRSSVTKTVGHRRPTKVTHTKVTHIKKNNIKRKIGIDEITEADMQKIADDYNIPMSRVIYNYEQLKAYVPNRTKRGYTDHRAALRSFVLRDIKQSAERGVDYARKTAIDASQL